MANNFVLLILPFAYWIFMTILMKNNEEKWLYEFGYMAHVSHVFDNTRIFDIVRNTLNL